MHFYLSSHKSITSRSCHCASHSWDHHYVASLLHAGPKTQCYAKIWNIFNMSKFLMFLTIALSSSLYAAEDVSGRTVNYVYQPDLAPTEFEFEANRQHDCGSSLYRVRSNDEATAGRKFSIVLAAFSAGKKIAFHDTGQCSGSRAIVSWVRITN